MNVFEVFFISLCIYIYLSVLLRIFGKKEFSQLNVFDFVVFLIIAEIMTDTVGNKDFTFFSWCYCNNNFNCSGSPGFNDNNEIKKIT